MRVGIVGNGEDKFTENGYEAAVELIRKLLSRNDTLVSGHSPVGGIDIWAEEVAAELGADTDIKIPEIHQWNPEGGYGYKARNLDIAKTSEVVHVILADRYPEDYKGRRFKFCYHCARNEVMIPDFAGSHIKSGGCWTGYKAIEAGNRAEWHIIHN
jgi:hypothetical protein